ncbi:unnamed protein product [Brassica oleracea]
MVYPHVEKETEQAIQATEDNSYHQSRKYSPVRGPDHMKKVMSSKKLQAEVRRLRVLVSETQGQVEETVESMLAITNPTGLATHQVTQHNQTPQHQTRD